MTVEAVLGPLDGEHFALRPGQDTFTAYDGRVVHVYEVEDDERMTYAGGFLELDYLRRRVAELEGRPV